MSALNEETVEHALDEGWTRATEALKAGDAHGMAALFTEDGTLLDPTMATVSGREHLRKTYESAFASTTFLDMTWQREGLSISGDYAVEYGVFTQITTDPNTEERTATRSRYLMVWKRVRESWLVFRDAGIPFPPDDPSG